jgi:hypothetical protein
MRHIKINILFTIIIALTFLLCYNKSYSQTGAKTYPVYTDSVIMKTPTNGLNENMSEKMGTCDGTDVRVFPSPNSQSEIHLSISHANPNVLLLSSNTVPNAYSIQGAYWSTNGGLTWAGSDHLPDNAYGAGDPSTAFDAAGNAYLVTLKSPCGGCEPIAYGVQKSTNNCTTWAPQVNGANVNMDKIMVAADDVVSSPYANNFYSVWTNFDVSNGRVEFNRSTNGGTTFSTPIGLNGNWGQGANVQTGPNGEVYVCWADYTNNNFPEQGLGFVRSVNGGTTFTAASVKFPYVGIRDYMGNNPTYNYIRVNSFPSMSVDKSIGPQRGRIYVVYTVKENGNGKSIVQIRWSDDKGDTWSAAKTINISNGRQNFFPWISVDATNGNIYVDYYSFDQPYAPTTAFNTNTYVAVSNDGGASFTNQKVSDASHITEPIQNFAAGYMGDYIGIAAYGGKAYAGWMDNRLYPHWQNYVSLVSNLDIIGSLYVCASPSQTYSISNLPAGSTVSYSVSPAGLVTLTQANNQATLTRIGNSNGKVTLTATVTNTCNTTNSTVLTKDIFVGVPLFTGGTYTSSGTTQSLMNYVNSTAYNNVCNYAPVTATVNTNNGGAVTWTKISSSQTINWSQSGGVLSFYLWTVGATAVFQASATNACGTATQQFGFKDIDCGGGGCGLKYSISPNPAHNEVVIIPNIPPPCRSANLNSQILEVKIYDAQGGVRISQKFSPNTQEAKINTSSLKPGLYIVDIFNGTEHVRNSLLITN